MTRSIHFTGCLSWKRRGVSTVRFDGEPACAVDHRHDLIGFHGTEKRDEVTCKKCVKCLQWADETERLGATT